MQLATLKAQAICVLGSCFPKYAGCLTNMFGPASLKLLREG